MKSIDTLTDLKVLDFVKALLQTFTEIDKKDTLFDISIWKVYVRNVANYLEKCFILFLFSEYLRDPILILNQETLLLAALVITLMKRIQN